MSPSPVLSTTSLQILALLENLEIDAGLTYLENEPLGRVTERSAADRALSPRHGRRNAAFRSRNRDVEGG